MNKTILFALLAAVSSGCVSLTATTPTTAEWTTVAVESRKTGEAKFGVARLAQLEVRQPYDVRPIAVSRADGSLAFDAYNRFAAVPSQILRGAALDVLAASGRFGSVVSKVSAATTDCLIEVTVKDILLVSKGEGQLEASVDVAILVLDGHREIAGSGSAAATSDASDGNYGAAFSRAFTEALTKATETL